LALLVAGLALVVAGAAATPARVAGVTAEPTVTAQSAGQSQAAATITIGEGAAPPDAQVVLPISLSVRSGVEVGAVEVRLGFPSRSLAFVKADPSGLAIGTGADVEAEVRPAGSEESPVLHVRVATRAEGGKRQGLGDGPIAYLTFRVAATARPQTTIALTHEASVWTNDDPPRTVAPVIASKAEVVVAAPPVTGCFFYMH
jgi:hypothetical protein